jgi:hypothetical protein
MKLTGAQKRKLQPWLKSYEWARRRCRDSSRESYDHYAGKGIKFHMTPTDFKHLWFRDEAYLMKRPSIDRIDSERDYTYDNCRYLELSDNCSRKYNTCHCKVLLPDHAEVA